MMPMLDTTRFTKVELDMLAVLSDGLGHTRDELHACCDDLSSIKVIKVHLCNIRKKLRPLGQDILIEFQKNRLYYKQVRLLYEAG